VLAYIAYTWRTIPRFQAAIDSCSSPFCDFTRFYYPMGSAVLRTGTLVQGFMYSPFIALLLALFSPLAINTSLMLWGFLQVGCVVLYLFLFRWLVPAGLRFQLIFVLIALTSFPLWHNLSWGQVGVITTVAMLGMVALLERGRRLSAAALVGFAASFKFFPLIFLAPIAFRRDFRFLLLAALALVAFFLVFPGVLIGPADTLTYYRNLLATFQASDWVVSNYNSQHFPHIILRLADSAGLDLRRYLSLLSLFSFSIAAVNLALVYLVQRARLPHADLWSVHLLFLSIPFVLKTSWPVDLVYISFAQALLAWQLLQDRSPTSAGEPPDRGQIPPTSRGVVLILLILSLVFSNILFLNFIGNFHAYGFLGFIFWADLLCLIASYILLLPRAWQHNRTQH